MKIKVPLHISGIWIPYLRDKIRESGSIGCGLNIDLYAELVDYSLNNCFIVLNNRVVLIDHSNYICNNTGLKLGVKIYSPIDLGNGFGVSAASTLIHALTTAMVKRNENLLVEYTGYAHDAEIIYRTGLGDVISQYYGGVELRLRPGAPGHGVVEKIVIRNNPELIACVMPGVETTPTMLSRIDKSVYKYGEKLLKELFSKPTLDSFFEKSQLFTRKLFDYKKIDELLNEWKSKVNGYYRKKQALVIWCERDWCNELMSYLNKYELICYKVFINTGGFRIVYTS